MPPEQNTGRCWDGLIGCEETKPNHEFKWHTRICNSCVHAVSARFGIAQSHFDALALLIHSDASLFRQAKYFGADKAKVAALQAGQELHLKRLLESIQANVGNDGKNRETMARYREWFRATAGIENIKNP